VRRCEVPKSLSALRYQASCRSTLFCVFGLILIRRVSRRGTAVRIRLPPARSLRTISSEAAEPPLPFFQTFRLITSPIGRLTGSMKSAATPSSQAISSKRAFSRVRVPTCRQGGEILFLTEDGPHPGRQGDLQPRQHGRDQPHAFNSFWPGQA